MTDLSDAAVGSPSSYTSLSMDNISSPTITAMEGSPMATTIGSMRDPNSSPTALAPPPPLLQQMVAPQVARFGPTGTQKREQAEAENRAAFHGQIKAQLAVLHSLIDVAVTSKNTKLMPTENATALSERLIQWVQAIPTPATPAKAEEGLSQGSLSNIIVGAEALSVPEVLINLRTHLFAVVSPSSSVEAGRLVTMASTLVHVCAVRATSSILYRINKVLAPVPLPAVDGLAPIDTNQTGASATELHVQALSEAVMSLRLALQIIVDFAPYISPSTFGPQSGGAGSFAGPATRLSIMACSDALKQHFRIASTIHNRIVKLVLLCGLATPEANTLEEVKAAASHIVRDPTLLGKFVTDPRVPQLLQELSDVIRIPLLYLLRVVTLLSAPNATSPSGAAPPTVVEPHVKITKDIHTLLFQLVEAATKPPAPVAALVPTTIVQIPGIGDIEGSTAHHPYPPQSSALQGSASTEVADSVSTVLFRPPLHQLLSILPTSSGDEDEGRLLALGLLQEATRMADARTIRIAMAEGEIRKALVSGIVTAAVSPHEGVVVSVLATLGAILRFAPAEACQEMAFLYTSCIIKLLEPDRSSLPVKEVVLQHIMDCLIAPMDDPNKPPLLLFLFYSFDLNPFLGTNGGNVIEDLLVAIDRVVRSPSPNERNKATGEEPLIKAGHKALSLLMETLAACVRQPALAPTGNVSEENDPVVALMSLRAERQKVADDANHNPVKVLKKYFKISDEDFNQHGTVASPASSELGSNAALASTVAALDKTKSLEAVDVPPCPEHLKPVIKEVVDFLMYTPSLSPASVGEFLSDNKIFPLQCCRELLSRLELRGHPITSALCEMLTVLQLPKEGQRIERLLEFFAEMFFEANVERKEVEVEEVPASPLLGTTSSPREEEDVTDPPTTRPTPACAIVTKSIVVPNAAFPYANVDATYVVTVATVMLNTDLHNPRIATKMTRTSFAAQLRGCNDGSHFPEGFATSIFEAISRKPLSRGGKSEGAAGGAGGGSGQMSSGGNTAASPNTNTVGGGRMDMFFFSNDEHKEVLKALERQRLVNDVRENIGRPSLTRYTDSLEQDPLLRSNAVAKELFVRVFALSPKLFLKGITQPAIAISEETMKETMAICLSGLRSCFACAAGFKCTTESEVALQMLVRVSSIRALAPGAFRAILSVAASEHVSTLNSLSWSQLFKVMVELIPRSGMVASSPAASTAPNGSLSNSLSSINGGGLDTKAVEPVWTNLVGLMKAAEISGDSTNIAALVDGLSASIFAVKPSDGLALGSYCAVLRRLAVFSLPNSALKKDPSATRGGVATSGTHKALSSYIFGKKFHSFFLALCGIHAASDECTQVVMETLMSLLLESWVVEHGPASGGMKDQHLDQDNKASSSPNYFGVIASVYDCVAQLQQQSPVNPNPNVLFEGSTTEPAVPSSSVAPLATKPLDAASEVLVQRVKMHTIDSAKALAIELLTNQRYPRGGPLGEVNSNTAQSDYITAFEQSVWVQLLQVFTKAIFERNTVGTEVCSMAATALRGIVTAACDTSACKYWASPSPAMSYFILRRLADVTVVGALCSDVATARLSLVQLLTIATAALNSPAINSKPTGITTPPASPPPGMLATASAVAEEVIDPEEPSAQAVASDCLLSLLLCIRSEKDVVRAEAIQLFRGLLVQLHLHQIQEGAEVLCHMLSEVVLGHCSTEEHSASLGGGVPSPNTTAVPSLPPLVASQSPKRLVNRLHRTSRQGASSSTSPYLRPFVSLGFLVHNGVSSTEPVAAESINAVTIPNASTSRQPSVEASIVKKASRPLFISTSFSSVLDLLIRDVLGALPASMVGQTATGIVMGCLVPILLCCSSSSTAESNTAQAQVTASSSQHPALTANTAVASRSLKALCAKCVADTIRICHANSSEHNAVATKLLRDTIGVMCGLAIAKASESNRLGALAVLNDFNGAGSPTPFAVSGRAAAFAATVAKIFSARQSPVPASTAHVSVAPLADVDLVLLSYLMESLLLPKAGPHIMGSAKPLQLLGRGLASPLTTPPPELLLRRGSAAGVYLSASDASPPFGSRSTEGPVREQPDPSTSATIDDPPAVGDAFPAPIPAAIPAAVADHSANASDSSLHQRPSSYGLPSASTALLVELLQSVMLVALSVSDASVHATVGAHQVAPSEPNIHHHPGLAQTSTSPVATQVPSRTSTAIATATLAPHNTQLQAAAATIFKASVSALIEAGVRAGDWPLVRSTTISLFAVFEGSLWRSTTAMAAASDASVATWWRAVSKVLKSEGDIVAKGRAEPAVGSAATSDADEEAEAVLSGTQSEQLWQSLAEPDVLAAIVSALPGEEEAVDPLASAFLTLPQQQSSSANAFAATQGLNVSGSSHHQAASAANTPFHPSARSASGALLNSSSSVSQAAAPSAQHLLHSQRRVGPIRAFLLLYIQRQLKVRQ